MPTVHLLVKGKVQGVFFRANAKKCADQNGVKGWVQNTPGGDVEIVASAPQQALDAFVAWCHKGTTAARVTAVEIKSVAESTFEDFEIKR